ncbi:hypothetical protein DUNSADRAFT_10069 [Dunaliella salina]|uniref:Uncharacterized protein n=1 Tax=Dunaliella salina TaxID=3046 RepID=A0ABQ7GG45_DUNSA|nr:hypothetical protein DUNSADRAFT_10069 [Dunaliella salina]|eukprot:KAF5833578.1 hypothetical protein DUNSADRAFT_10069 [Dunaliella salina]
MKTGYTVIEQGITWNRTMKVPLALDSLSHQLFPSACHQHLLASRANISEVQFQRPSERPSDGQHLFSNTCTTLPGSPSALEQQAIRDLTSTFPGHERELMASQSFSRTTSNLPDTVIPWAALPSFGPATTPCMETVAASVGGGGKVRGASREELEVAASGRSFVGGRARGVGGHAEGMHTLLSGRKSQSQWRRASALLPHGEMADGGRQAPPRSKSFSHLKHLQLSGSRRSAGGMAPSNPSSQDSSAGFCHSNLPRAQHSHQSMTMPAIPPNGSFTLGTHPNLHASASGFHQHSQPHQAVRLGAAPLPNAQELLEPTGGVFCKGLGMLDTYLWSPPSSWADETDLPSDFFDLLTPSTVSHSSSHPSSESDELHELPERRDVSEPPPVSAFNRGSFSFMAEGISEEGEEFMGSNSDRCVPLGDELQPHLSHRESQNEGMAVESRDHPSKADMRARHGSSGGSTTNIIPASAQGTGGSRRMRESRLSSTNGAAPFLSSVPSDSHMHLPLPPMVKASGLTSSQSFSVGKDTDVLAEVR